MNFAVHKLFNMLNNLKSDNMCPLSSPNDEVSNTNTLNNLFEYDSETGNYKLSDDSILNDKEKFVQALIDNNADADLSEEELGQIYDAVASRDGEEGMSEEELKWLSGLANEKEEELGTVINGNGINELDIKVYIETESLFSATEETDEVEETDDDDTVIIPNDHNSAAEETNTSYSTNSYTSDTKDGEITDTKQSDTGDCWLLADINSLSYTEAGQKIIEEALEYQDGYTTVHLAIGDVIITDEELSAAKESEYYSSGDDDMVILELAIEAARDAIANGDIEVSDNYPYFNQSDITETTTGESSLNEGISSEAIYLLTGIKYNNYIKTYKENEINEELDEFIENEGSNYVLTAGTKEKVTVTDVNGEKINLSGPHAFSVKSADEDTVTLTDPWDSSKDIVLTREEFINSFSYLLSVDLSEEGDTSDITVVNEDETASRG